MILRIIQTAFAALALVNLGWLGKQFKTDREPSTGKDIACFWGLGFVANFFDYLGIGSFAPSLAFYRLTKTVKDDLIPGTLVVGCVIPVAIEALVSISIIEVEIPTLIALYLSGILGSLIGGKIAVKLNVNVIRVTMGIGLLVAAALMLMSKLGLTPMGGEAIGLSGIKLIVGMIGCFILAALLTVGIGNYAPTMVLVYLLGMNPKVAFPIMMGLGTLGVSGGQFPYFQSGKYNKQAALGFAIAGIPAVLIAAFIVKSMPVSALQWIVIAVCIYTGITMLMQAIKERNSNKK